MITISVRDASGNLLATASHPEECTLCISRAYQPGDVIAVSGPDMLYIKMDQAMEGSAVCLPQGRMTWPVPAGAERLSYAPGIFEAPRHVIHARSFASEEIRNISCNPADLRGNTDFYPHCTANVETRGEAVFAARNVIDGLRCNTSHGEWPYESWGIGAREDAWIKLDFGREVILDRMALTLRADFPHDAYWVSGEVEGSDGEKLFFPLEKTGERQWIALPPHRVTWLRLQNLVKSDDPSAFPSLRAWEVFGRDAGK